MINLSWPDKDKLEECTETIQVAEYTREGIDIGLII